MYLIGLLSLMSLGLIASSGDDGDVTPDTSPQTPPLPEEEEIGTVDLLDAATGDTPAAPNALVESAAADGSNAPDSVTISEAAGVGENADRDYVITAAPEADEIRVGYDAATTFLIEPDAQTNTIRAALNSNIESAPSTFESTTTEEMDDAGQITVQTVLTGVYDSAIDIEIAVDQSQIGTHVAQIDLSNPADSLHFEFDDSVTGNVHLITNEVETSLFDTTGTTTTMYVIETPADVTSLDPAMIADILSNDGTEDAATRVIAEVLLGSDKLNMIGTGSEASPFRSTIFSFLNEAPQITANVEWTSEGTHDGTVPQTDAGVMGAPVIFGPFPQVDLTPFVPNVVAQPEVPEEDTAADTPTTTPVTTPVTPEAVPDILDAIAELEGVAGLEGLEGLDDLGALGGLLGLDGSPDLRDIGNIGSSTDPEEIANIFGSLDTELLGEEFDPFGTVDLLADPTTATPTNLIPTSIPF